MIFATGFPPFHSTFFLVTREANEFYANSESSSKSLDVRGSQQEISLLEAAMNIC